MDQFLFERISESNLSCLIPLFKECFNHKISIEYLSKKYNTDEFGVKYLGYLAIDSLKSKPIAYYGVFPIISIYGNERVLCAQSGDTMTHPDYQGKGLFIKLAEETYKLAKIEGVNFVFGFPNSNSYWGFIKKLNWIHYADINNYIIKTNVLPFDKIVKKFPILYKVYNHWIQKHLKSYPSIDAVPNTLPNQIIGCGYLLHNKVFFNYKSYSSLYKIRIKNTNCVIKIDGRLWVGDLEFTNEINFLEIFTELKLLAKKLGCSSIQYSAFDQSLYDSELRKLFKIKTTNPVGCLALSNTIDPTKFAYQGIDFDTY